MAICSSLISQDIAANCANPLYKGLEGLAYIINREDIDILAVTNGVVKADATGLKLKTGASAYHVQMASKVPYEGTTKTLNAGNISNKVDKSFKVVINNDGPDINENIVKKLLNGEFVVIFERKWNNTTGNAKFEIFGAETGLKVDAYDQDYNNADTDSGIEVTLKEEGAPTPGIYVFDTDVATTRTYLEGLV